MPTTTDSDSSENEVLLEEVSPHGSLMAVVEADERVVYLYLHGHEGNDFGMRACWVRNLAAAPEDFQVEDMKEGLAPMLPAGVCAHPDGAEPLAAHDLTLVWLEECDGVALLGAGDEVLAVLPAWSGEKGFSGYARDCTGESPVAFPLTEDNELRPRILSSKGYWLAWTGEDGPWSQYQPMQMKAYEAVLGEHARYFGVDGGQWPPRALVRWERGDHIVLATLGMGMNPQPRVELYAEDPGPLRRIELAAALPTSLPEEAVNKAMQLMAGLAGFPWAQLTWLGPGHTVAADLELGGDAPFESVLLHPEPPGAPALRLSPFRGDDVRLLWLLPVTAGERELSEAEGSEALRARFQAEGVGHVWTPERKLVV